MFGNDLFSGARRSGNLFSSLKPLSSGSSTTRDRTVTTSSQNSLGENKKIEDPSLNNYISNHLTFMDGKKLQYVSKPLVEKKVDDLRVGIFTWNLEDVNLCAYGKEKTFFKRCVRADFAEKLFKEMKSVDILTVSLKGGGNSEKFIDSLLRENILNGYKAKSVKEKKGPANLVLFYKKSLDNLLSTKGRTKLLECKEDGKDPLFFSTSSAANIIEIGYAEKNLFLFFVSAILPSTKEGRNVCLERIIGEIEKEKKGDWSAVYFISGDLKYQIDTPEKIPRLESVKTYYQKDELALFLKGKEYSETPIEFLPTCHVEKTKTESKDGKKRYREYVDVEKEPPSWCDRIIYKSKGKIDITPLRYDDMDYGDAVTFSSHKPVVGIYDIKKKSESFQSVR